MSGHCIYETDPGDRFGWSGAPCPPTTCDAPCEGDLCEDHEENPC